MINASQAAKIIGCTAQHVRFLIRTNRLRATRAERLGPNGRTVTRYLLELAEVKRYRKKRFARGRPRASKNLK